MKKLFPSGRRYFNFQACDRQELHHNELVKEARDKVFKAYLQEMDDSSDDDFDGCVLRY